MQKTLIGVLGVTTVALGVLCAVQWKQLQANKERLRAAEAGWRDEAQVREEQAARVKEMERKSERLEKQMEQFVTLTASLRAKEAQSVSNLTALADQIRAARPPGETGGSNQGPGGVFGKEMGAMLSNMMKDPDMREMMRGQQKAAINMMYSGMFKELNLSAEEKEKLMGILTEAQMKNIESAQGLFGSGTSDAGEDARKQFEAARQQTDDEIKALLGEDRFAQYQDYQKHVSERMQLGQLKNHLEGQNLPLQEQQSAQLLQVMKEEKVRVPPVIPTDNTQFWTDTKNLFTAENFDRQMQWMDDYNRRVTERAAQFLTPEQLEQYSKFQEQQSSMQKIGLKMAREMFGAEKGNVPAEVIPK
jgi:hypothetical protein